MIDKGQDAPEEEERGFAFSDEPVNAGLAGGMTVNEADPNGKP